MNPLSPTEIQQKIAEATLLNARMQGDPNAPMISSRNKSRIKDRPRKEKLPSVATVLRKVVQGHLEAGEIDPAVPFTREDMLKLLEEEQREAQLPTKVFRSYYDAVIAYPLGCLWIYLNWDKRPRPTKVGNLFRTITLYDSGEYGDAFMCHHLCRFYPKDPLAKAAYGEIEKFLHRQGYGRGSLAIMLKGLVYKHGVVFNITFDVRNHFYHNWELFHKNPKAIFYKVKKATRQRTNQ